LENGDNHDIKMWTTQRNYCSHFSVLLLNPLPACVIWCIKVQILQIVSPSSHASACGQVRSDRRGSCVSGQSYIIHIILKNQVGAKCWRVQMYKAKLLRSMLVALILVCISTLEELILISRSFLWVPMELLDIYVYPAAWLTSAEYI
jgi:hypothetical protein